VAAAAAAAAQNNSKNKNSNSNHHRRLDDQLSCARATEGWMEIIAPTFAFALRNSCPI